MLEISFRRVRVRLVAGTLTSGVRMTSRRSRARRRRVLLSEATRTPGSCQVRSKTESPCPRRAALEIRGIPFCEACACEQETYFAIGELTQEVAQGFRGKPLAEALERMRRERAGGRKGIAAKMHQGLSGADESEPLALMKS
jgi:ribosomal protein S6E (S10)